MRELNLEETLATQGGFVITATVLTLIASGIVASIYFGNTLLSLYVYDKTGTMPAQPANGGTAQIGGQINTISTAIGAITHK